MPRLLITNINRLRSPLLSWLRSSSQVSTSEDTSTSLVSTPRGVGQRGHHAGDPAALEQVDVAGDDLGRSPGVGSDLAQAARSRRARRALGSKSSMSRWSMARCSSNPKAVGRTDCKRSRPASTQRRRSIPMERMLRISWPGDSSSETNSTRSPRSHAALGAGRGDAGLPGARAAADHHRRAAVDAPAQHLVELGDADRDLARRRPSCSSADRGDRHDDDALGR